MVELEPLRGIKVGAEQLGFTPRLRQGMAEVVEKLQHLLGEDINIYLFGGGLRNTIFKWLGHKIVGETDIDILVETTRPPYEIFPQLGKDETFQPLVIVSEDAVRIHLEKVDSPIDIKFTYTVKSTPFDFSVNAVIAPLIPILRGEKVDVYAYSIKDFEKRILRHIAPFPAYPFHMLRGVRLASTLGLKIHHSTLSAYFKYAKQVNTVNIQLLHRELSKAISQAFEEAVRLLFVTSLAPHIFPPLLKIAKTDKDGYIRHSLLAYEIVRQFNPQKGDKEIKKMLGAKLVKQELAPQRPLIYSYAVAAMLLPLDYQKALKVLIEKNFFPMERGLILQCLAAAKEPAAVRNLPLVYPFYRAVTLAQAKVQAFL